MGQEDHDTGEGREIAVIGMAGRFPGARDLDRLWDNLRRGVEAVSFLSDEELAAAGVSREELADSTYVKAASLLEGVEEFDAGFFGYRAREAEILDPQQRLFLEHAWQALEDAGYVPATCEGLIGVYAGVAWNTYLLSNLTSHRELFAGAGGFQMLITSDKDFMPTRVSYKLDLKGPSVTVQTSCSTSLVATHLACLSLLSYECDLALVGGVTVKVPQKAGYFYQEGGMASPDGHCRAFDARAAGTIFGSGIGVVVLKRLAEAIRDGDRIRAVIRGSAINNDGAVKVSYTAPSVEGQAEVVAAAQEMAGVEPDTIGYVETHGTGTSLGDPIEVRALTKVFRHRTEAEGFCALGSVKSNFGHLDAASGVAGLIKTVLALEHRELPPSLHYEEPNPDIDFAGSPFYVNSRLRPWPRLGPLIPRRAGVSSFGVGGTNAHVVLEQAPPGEPSGPSRRWQLLVLSARSEAALERATENLADHLRGTEPAADPAAETAWLADVAYTLRCGRAVFRHRRALVCRSREQAVAILSGGEPQRLLTATDDGEPRRRPVVFLFSGQGSQYPGMAGGLYEHEPVFRQAVDRCARQLEPELGCDLSALLWPAAGSGEEEARKLARTRWTQPALFVIEYALSQLWRAWGVEPRAMIGHSIGEYVAACLAGVLTLDDALALVAARGRLMDALPTGAMLAVPLAEAEVVELLAAPAHRGLAIAAVNESRRVVVSGPEEAVAAFEAALASGSLTGRPLAGRRLHTSHAFHSSMMDPILDEFTDAVGRVRLAPPQIPYVSNVTGTWITAEEATDPGYWAHHLRRPVRFAEGIATLLAEPRNALLEIGPGRALATLSRRHPGRHGQPVVTSLPHARDAAEDLAHLLGAYGQLWLAGVELDARAFYAGERRHRTGLPTYPFERRRYWIEPGERPAAAAALGGGAVGKRPEIADWFYLPSWKPTLPPAVAAGAERWLVLAAPGTLGASLAAHLASRGRRVVTAVPGDGFRHLGEGSYTLDPRREEDYGELLAALGPEEAPEVIVHAWSLSEAAAPPVTTAEAFEAAQERGFYSLLRLARALGRRAGSPVDLTVLTNGLERVVAGEPLRPEKATLLGAVRVLPQEMLGVRCRAVDVVPVAAGSREETRLVARLAAEVTARSDDEVLAYRGRQRWVQSFEPVRLPATGDGGEGIDDDGGVPAPLRARGVYLLTGGLVGNGYAVARFLAGAARARLVLLEETPVTAPVEGDGEDARAARVRELEALGAEVLVLAADLADPAAVAPAVDEAESRFGPLHGVVHTAGAVGERNFQLLAEAGGEECGWHFRPRIHGLLALEAALAGRPGRPDPGRPDPGRPDFCLLLSSLATVLGGLAYGPYAASNLFLDAFARERGDRGGLPWRSVDWDVWELEGEEEQITTLRPELAELAMTPRQGEEALRRLLVADADQILISTGELPARLAQRRERIAGHRGAAALDLPAPGERHPRPQLPTPFATPETDLERQIVGVWQELLGFESIGTDDNFFELGGDSFVAVQVAARLHQALGVELPVAQLYQGVTPRSLARLLEGDETARAEQLAAQLDERRQSASRRKDFLEKKRSQKTAGRS